MKTLLGKLLEEHGVACVKTNPMPLTAKFPAKGLPKRLGDLEQRAGYFSSLISYIIKILLRKTNYHNK